MLLVKARYKWLEVFIVPSTSLQAVIDKLRVVLATHGLPELLVLDNIPSFSSDDFEKFTLRNRIQNNQLIISPIC